MHSSINGHPDWFHNLLLWLILQLTWEYRNHSHMLSSFEYISWSGTSVLYDSLVSLGSYTVFHNGCSNLNSQQQHISITFSLQPDQLSLFFDFFISYYICSEMILHCGFYCIFLVVNNIEQIFMCFLDICISFFEKFSIFKY